MCRNIKPLFNYSPPSSKNEIKEASLQYVRKISGYKIPSKINELQFETAVNEIALASEKLLKSLITNSKPKDREVEIDRKILKSNKRFQK